MVNRAVLQMAHVAATNTNAVGFENGGAPTNRSYTFNLTVGF